MAVYMIYLNGGESELQAGDTVADVLAGMGFSP